jgi:alpha-galactosidase
VPVPARDWGDRVAEIAVDPDRARVHAEGWQSWTPTTTYSLSQRQWAPARDALWVSGYGGSRPRPPVDAPQTFQGDGLVVVDPGNGDDVLMIGALSADQPVATIRCSPAGTGRVEVRSNGAVVTMHSPAARGIEGAKAVFADAFATASGVAELRRVPTVWCSWYEYFTRVTEADVLENLQAVVDSNLPVEVLQLDDGYQAEVGDWLSLSGRFQSLEGMVGRIRDSGLRAGIWVAPFIAGARSQLVAEHPGWLLRTATGEPVVAIHNWDQDVYSLDVTHPGVQEYLHGVFAGFTRIGIDFFKIDFVYAAALDGQRHNPSDSGVGAYRQGLDHIRAAVGRDAYLLGCGAPLLPSVGKVDAMRVGPDTAPHWAAANGDLSQPGGESAELTVPARSYMQGRYWVNDPDCLLARPGAEQRERRADLIERYGGLRASSDRIRSLDGWGLATTARLLESVPAPRPFSSVR